LTYHLIKQEFQQAYIALCLTIFAGSRFRFAKTVKLRRRGQQIRKPQHRWNSTERGWEKG